MPDVLGHRIRARQANGRIPWQRHPWRARLTKILVKGRAHHIGYERPSLPAPEISQPDTALVFRTAQQRLPRREERSTDPPVIDDLGLQKSIAAIQPELPGQQHLKTGLDTARLRLADIQETRPWPTHEGNQLLVRIVKVGGAQQGTAIQERLIQANFPTQGLLGLEVRVADDQRAAGAEIFDKACGADASHQANPQSSPSHRSPLRGLQRC
jgi:hypothetical protein